MLNTKDFSIGYELTENKNKVFVQTSNTENWDMVLYTVFPVEDINGKILFDKPLRSTYSVDELNSFITDNLYERIG